jgi:hypothetical protein
MSLTAVQKLQYAILQRERELSMGQDLPTSLTSDQIDELWEDFEDEWGAMSEVRESGECTGLDAPYSRHYESDAVAIQCPDGSWVGFTYWYGGGKHGEPEAIDWIEYAYDVECKEEQKMMTVRTFTKGENA